MNAPTSDRVRIAGFELDLRTGELFDDKNRAHLQDQPFQILRLLIMADGKLVTREDIKNALWPNDTIVEFDDSINAAIKNLRRVLGDSANQPRYIETLARRGYRLMVPVEWLGLKSSSADAIGDTGRTAARLLQPNLIGQKVSHYRVLEVLGGGGMGMVYKAEDLKLGREVALKFLPEELARDPAALRRFEREARAASSLDHANICTIHEVEEHEGQPFIVMQLLQGATLRDRLSLLTAAQKKLAVPELLDIASQICDGLEAAHARGIIHRDIKPANIFLTTSGQVKILDFGLAKLVAPTEKRQALGGVTSAAGNSASMASPELTEGHTDNRDASSEIGVSPVAGTAHDGSLGMADADGASNAGGGKVEYGLFLDATLTRFGVAMGTAGYMSPEQVRGENLDARTDIFSFGLVLYEMATGLRAFTGETAAAVHNAILNRAPAPARQLNSELSPALEHAIGTALEKDREQRYQTAAELGRELRRLKGKDSRHSRLWVAASLILVLLSLSVVGFLRRHGEPTQELTERQLTANPLEDPVTGAAISPDGKYVAYADVKGLYLRNVESGETHPVTVSSYLRNRVSSLSWFPTGQMLLATAPGADGYNDIWVITLVGKEEPRLLYRHGWEPAISPDGQRIVFSGDEPGKTGRELWVGRISGEAPRKVLDTGEEGSLYSPAWSPDGYWIAYGRRWKTTAGPLASAIEVRPAIGGPARTLVAESSLPKSNKFTFLFDTAGTFTESWSADGRLLFSVAERSDAPAWMRASLWALRIKPGTPEADGRLTRLTPLSEYWPLNLTVTSDGRRLSFIKVRTWKDVYLGELNPDSSSMTPPRRLTLDNRGSSAQFWSRDSKAIFLDSKRNGKWQIFRQGLSEDVAQSAVAESTDVWGLGMTPDASWMLYVQSESTSGTETLSDSRWLMRRAMNGGSPERVLRLAATDFVSCSLNPNANPPCVLGLTEGVHLVFYWFDPVRGKGSRLGQIDVSDPWRVDWGLSPDSSRVALIDWDKDARQIKVLTFKSGDWRAVSLEPSHETIRQIAWAADGKGFFVTGFTLDSPELLRITLSGQVHFLASNPRRQWFQGPLPSPDGKYLAYSTQTNDSNVWLIDNF